MEKLCEPSRDLRVKSIRSDVHTGLKKKAAREGIAMTKLLKPYLKAVADSYPDYMKDGIPAEASPEIRITGVSGKVRRELQSVADYLQIEVGTLLKIKLVEYNLGFVPGTAAATEKRPGVGRFS